MNRSVRSCHALAILALLTAYASFGASDPSNHNAAARSELRFEKEIRAFAEADHAKPPVRGGILFVGSSIFRQWTNVAEMMAPLPVLNRAFGGSRTGEQLERFEQIVTPYAPKVIVYYCGSNDLKADEAPDPIFERFKAFSERARRSLPETRIVFVSSTRSPDRVGKWDRVNRYNALVRDYCAGTPHHTFIDINPALFDANGQPRLELYQKDQLHFHPPAYVEFAAIIKSVLTRVWSEVVASMPAPAVKPLSANPDLQSFLNCQVVPKLGNAWDYMFAPGKFPAVEWDRPEAVERVMGSFPLKVRWFDGEGREVSSAERPGRYAFYAEGTTPGGMTIRRGATLFCRPKDWDGWSEKLKAYLDFIPLDGLTRSAWDEHREAIAGFAGRTVLLSILRQREGAVLMSYLHELKSASTQPASTDTPLIRDHEYHLALKRKILGVETRFPSLRLPRRSEAKSASVVHRGTEADAGFKPGTVGKLREVCREWFEHSREPFNLVVARRGVVVLDESFGHYTWGPLTWETPTEMASITKLVTGILFAQFVDQGLIGIDDPVGKYLPDFPVTGSNVLTLRHCFTHATALDGHEEWGGMHNPWLDNVIANAGDRLWPGQVHNYSGMGYDLAGKVMEIVSGKSIFRLVRVHLFDPLSMTHTTLEEDLGFSCFSTAADFARLGQMLLNRGAYGEFVFFSPQTFEQLLPQPLSRFYPAITNKDWGIGITWMRQRHPEAGTNGIPKDATVLSRSVIGHGSATAAILRVDLDNELVITQTRRRGGADYDKHLMKLLLAIEAGLKVEPTKPQASRATPIRETFCPSTATDRQPTTAWNQFRGPNGQGVAPADRIPVHFGSETNRLWKIKVPAGHSSPVVWSNHLFLTATESTNRKELLTLAIDRMNGTVLWRRAVQAERQAVFHELNNAASSTPTADEKHVYVYFGTYGLICYDHAGKEVWQRRLDTPRSKYGMATSPILYSDTLILVQDGDGGASRLLAVHRNTGKTVWEQPRPLFKAGWSTPMIFRQGEAEELVVLGSKRLTAYHPSTGEEIWWAGGFPEETVGVPVAGEGLVFASAAALGGRGDDQWDAAATWKMTVGEFDRNHDNQIQREEMTAGFAFIQRPELPRDNPGYGLPVRGMDTLLKIFDHDKNGVISEGEWMAMMSGFAAISHPCLMAFRSGATNDARKTHMVWQTQRGVPEVPSLLCHRGRLYLLRDGGLLTCLKVAIGEELFRERIGAPGQYIASPIAVDDRVVVASVPGVVTVIQAADELKVLARNNFQESIFATPAVAGGRIYLRTVGHLYALGE